ncbi:MAG: hypothetical protein AAF602_11230, partial [Myxococcota bacterium]
MRVASIVAMSWACSDRVPAYDLDFDVPRSEAFAPLLSDYGLYQEPAASLEPAADVLLYELSSELFTDYARKQRLVRVPEGSSVSLVDDTLAFPEGTVLAKTFYYPDDMRSASSSRRILETRLLVKTEGLWNAATYLWNEPQTEATLLLTGWTTETTWIDPEGQSRTTEYVVPHEGECVTCHQADDTAVFLGPTLVNLNRPVMRDGIEQNQLDYLASEGVLEVGAGAAMPSVPDYRDATVPLDERVRAYLDINCAHCHNPGGWEEATERELDVRFTTPLIRTGIERKADELP